MHLNILWMKTKNWPKQVCLYLTTIISVALYTQISDGCHTVNIIYSNGSDRPLSTQEPNLNESTTKSSTISPNQTSIEKLKSNGDCKCGQMKNCIDGDENCKERPWLAKITINKDVPSKESEVVCSASLINKNLLLSAAHCFCSTVMDCNIDLKGRIKERNYDRRNAPCGYGNYEEEGGNLGASQKRKRSEHCTEDDNYNYDGVTSDWRQSRGKEECGSSCFHTPSCKFWSFDKNNKTCWMKTSKLSKKEDDHFVSGSKMCYKGCYDGGCYDGHCITYCHAGSSAGDNTGEDEHEILTDEYNGTCINTCKSLHPFKAVGVTEKVFDKYKSGQGKNMSKCFCEFGKPKLNILGFKADDYRTCMFELHEVSVTMGAQMEIKRIVNKIIVHPLYYQEDSGKEAKDPSKGSSHDIAIIVLHEPVDLMPICLPPAGPGVLQKPFEDLDCHLLHPDHEKTFLDMTKDGSSLDEILNCQPKDPDTTVSSQDVPAYENSFLTAIASKSTPKKCGTSVFGPSAKMPCTSQCEKGEATNPTYEDDVCGEFTDEMINYTETISGKIIIHKGGDKIICYKTENISTPEEINKPVNLPYKYGWCRTCKPEECEELDDWGWCDKECEILDGMQESELEEDMVSSFVYPGCTSHLDVDYEFCTGPAVRTIRTSNFIYSNGSFISSGTANQETRTPTVIPQNDDTLDDLKECKEYAGGSVWKILTAKDSRDTWKKPWTNGVAVLTGIVSRDTSDCNLANKTSYGKHARISKHLGWISKYVQTDGTC